MLKSVYGVCGGSFIMPFWRRCYSFVRSTIARDADLESNGAGCMQRGERAGPLQHGAAADPGAGRVGIWTGRAVRPPAHSLMASASGADLVVQETCGYRVPSPCEERGRGAPTLSSSGRRSGGSGSGASGLAAPSHTPAGPATCAAGGTNGGGAGLQAPNQALCAAGPSKAGSAACEGRAAPDEAPAPGAQGYADGGPSPWAPAGRVSDFVGEDKPWPDPHPLHKPHSQPSQRDAATPVPPVALSVGGITCGRAFHSAVQCGGLEPGEEAMLVAGPERCLRAGMGVSTHACTEAASPMGAAVACGCAVAPGVAAVLAVQQSQRGSNSPKRGSGGRRGAAPGEGTGSGSGAAGNSATAAPPGGQTSIVDPPCTNNPAAAQPRVDGIPPPPIFATQPTLPDATQPLASASQLQGTDTQDLDAPQMALPYPTLPLPAGAEDAGAEPLHAANPERAWGCCRASSQPPMRPAPLPPAAPASLSQPTPSAANRTAWVCPLVCMSRSQPVASAGISPRDYDRVRLSSSQPAPLAANRATWGVAVGALVGIAGRVGASTSPKCNPNQPPQGAAQPGASVIPASAWVGAGGARAGATSVAVRRPAQAEKRPARAAHAPSVEPAPAAKRARQAGGVAPPTSSGDPGAPSSQPVGDSALGRGSHGEEFYPIQTPGPCACTQSTQPEGECALGGGSQGADLHPLLAGPLAGVQPSQPEVECALGGSSQGADPDPSQAVGPDVSGIMGRAEAGTEVATQDCGQAAGGNCANAGLELGCATQGSG